MALNKIIVIAISIALCLSFIRQAFGYSFSTLRRTSKSTGNISRNIPRNIRSESKQ